MTIKRFIVVIVIAFMPTAVVFFGLSLIATAAEPSLIDIDTAEDFVGYATGLTFMGVGAALSLLITVIEEAADRVIAAKRANLRDELDRRFGVVSETDEEMAR